MGRLINIGYGNQVNSDKIVAIIGPDSAPSRRLIQAAKEQGVIIDGTQGRRTKAVIVTDSGHVVLSALLPETISSRYPSSNKFDTISDVKEDEK